MLTEPPTSWMRAWRRETISSTKTMSRSLERPTMISRLSSSGNSPPWYLPEIKRSASLILWARGYAETASKFTLIAIVLQAAPPHLLLDDEKNRREATDDEDNAARFRGAPQSPERALSGLVARGRRPRESARPRRQPPPPS